MGGTLVIKRGNSLTLNGTFEQSNSVAMDIASFEIRADITDDNGRVMIAIREDGPTDRKVTVTDAVHGKFTVFVKDTSVLRGEEYWMDFTYVTPDGVQQATKAIKIKVKNRLV